MLKYSIMIDNKERLKEEVIKIIKDTIEEQFTDEGLELIDLEIKGNDRNNILRVFIDKQGGITLNDCEKFSKCLSVVLDVKNSMKIAYKLEVSSPGERKRKIF